MFGKVRSRILSMKGEQVKDMQFADRLELAEWTSGELRFETSGTRRKSINLKLKVTSTCANSREHECPTALRLLCIWFRAKMTQASAIVQGPRRCLITILPLTLSATRGWELYVGSWLEGAGSRFCCHGPLGKHVAAEARGRLWHKRQESSKCSISCPRALLRLWERSLDVNSDTAVMSSGCSQAPLGRFVETSIRVFLGRLGENAEMTVPSKVTRRCGSDCTLLRITSSRTHFLDFSQSVCLDHHGFRLISVVQTHDPSTTSFLSAIG